MKNKINMAEIFCTILLVVFLIIFLYPLIRILLGSISDTSFFYFDFEKINYEKYIKAFKSASLQTGVKNSLFIAIVGSFLGTFISVCGGYVLAQKNLPGRKFLAAIIVIPFVFNAGIIPVYLVIKKINLLYTLWGVIFTGVFNALYIFYLKSVFENVPGEMIDSARLDGAHDGAIFWKVVFPFSKSAIMMVWLMYVMNYWNDYINSKMFTNKNGLHTFQVNLYNFYEVARQIWCGASDPYDERDICVRIVIAIIPSVIFMLISNHYLNSALELGREKE